MSKVTIDSEFRIQLPPELRERFPVGCTVNIEVDAQGRLLISPHKYSLAELLAETPPDSVLQEWETFDPVGRELE